MSLATIFALAVVAALVLLVVALVGTRLIRPCKLFGHEWINHAPNCVHCGHRADGTK